MKTLYTLTVFFCCLFFTNIQAQELLEVGSIPFDNSVLVNHQQAQQKSTSCNVDTVRYTIAKANGFAALNINNATSASAGGQYFDAPQTLTVHGVDFYAYAITQPSVTVNVSLYTAGVDSLPFGGPLATTTVSVDSSFGGGQLAVLRKTAVFPSPLTLSVPYVIVVENNSADNIGLVSNAYDMADGQQEWLSSLVLGGTWIRSYNVNVNSTTPFDADWIFNPIVSYDLRASFNPGDQCLNATGSSTKTFTNTSSGALFNRMYNQAAFLDVAQFSCIWDFGDASPLVNAIDTSYTYSIPGTYNVTLADSMYAWTSTCYADTTLSLTTTPDASFNVGLNALEVSFMPSDTNLVDYFWDFGDGDTSSSANPLHIYASPGTYAVCFTAANACSTALTCNTITVTCQNPIADFTWTDSLYNVDFTDATIGLSGGSLFWDFGDGDTSNLINPSHVFPASGSYNVCLTASSVCGVNTSCELVDVICPLPQIDFRIDPIDTTGLAFLFSDSSSTIGTASYNWDFGDGNSSIQSSEYYTYSSSGTYTVCITVTDYCGSDTACATLNVGTSTSITDMSFSGIQWYPNPSEGSLYFDMTQDPEEYALSIYNLLGQLVFEDELSSDHHQVDVRFLEKGIYILSLEQSGKQWVDKLELK